MLPKSIDGCREIRKIIRVVYERGPSGLCYFCAVAFRGTGIPSLIPGEFVSRMVPIGASRFEGKCPGSTRIHAVPVA